MVGSGPQKYESRSSYCLTLTIDPHTFRIRVLYTSPQVPPVCSTAFHRPNDPISSRPSQRAYGPGHPYHWPSYDAMKLAHALVSRIPGRTLTEVKFYTGVPSHFQDANWHAFWNNKLRALQRQGVIVYRQELSVRGQEKGIDVRLAAELVHATAEQLYDLAIIVSQDADLAPAVALARDIARGAKPESRVRVRFPVGARQAQFRNRQDYVGAHRQGHL